MASIIKSDTLLSDASGVHSVEFNFEDISEKANRYLETVRKQAEQILADARLRADQIAAQAKAAGEHAALVEAEQRVHARLDENLQTLLPAVRAAINGIGYEKERWLKHWEEETVKLAGAIAARIVRRELSQDPQITVSLVREALQLAMGSGRLRLHLNPADYASLGDQTARLTSEFSELAPADIVADDTVEAGGCRVVTEFGSLDQGIEIQLERIQNELL